MPPQISRREQAELDELLGDIYRGIETLPDKSLSSYDIVRQDSRDNINNRSRHQQQQQQQRPPARVIGRAHIRQYELPESSPLVQQHKQELRGSSLRDTNSPRQDYNSAIGLGRSDIKEQHQQETGGGAHGERTQSLATFLNANPVGSVTPENRRRVRIVDPASANCDDKEEDYALNDYQNESALINNNNNNNNNSNSHVRKKKSYRATPTTRNAQEKVKYVNTNKFIYHQERDPDDDNDEPLDYLSDLDESERANIIHQERVNQHQHQHQGDDDDIDGVTRVEYYHTSWLDRQLGRATKRRSSKELNERQVREKAMIDELKRSLKSGAITLRQSLKGTKSRASPKENDLFNDLDNSIEPYREPTNKGNNRRIKDSPSKVIASGLATIPKSHHHHHQHQNSNQHHNSKSLKHANKQTNSGQYWLRSNNEEKVAKSQTLNYNTAQQQQSEPLAATSAPYSQFDSVYRSSNATFDELYPLTVNNQNNNQVTVSGSYIKPQAAPIESMQNQYRAEQNQNQYPASNRQQQQHFHSRTLPHKRAEQHQLLQSHYRGTLKDKSSALLNSTSSTRPSPLPKTTPSTLTKTTTAIAPTRATPIQTQQQATFDTVTGNSNKMRNTPTFNNNACSPNPYSGGAKSPIQQQQQAATTISGIPSATEVVRSALSRSGSPISLNQLNKTINLLPNSPPVAPSPMSPSQQLKAATPSLSPSPTPGLRSPVSHQPYSSKTLGHPQQQYLPGQVVLHGTRTVGRPPQEVSPKPQTQQQQQQQQQPVYANPHASFMQHRMEQQMKQPNRNVASIREFNELDSLLRSLGPGATSGSSVQTHITPGYSSKPNQPTFGGYLPANQQQQQQQQRFNQPSGDIYAQVHKPGAQQQAQLGTQQQRPIGAGFAPAPAPSTVPFGHGQQQGYTIDVTNKKFDENVCRRDELSEFETPIELVPSMEDYQNIAKLNPVKNHYWYKPNMSRDVAISLLKDKPQGTFIVRDSTSFRGAYGLAVKVAKLPKNILANLRNNSDPSAEFIRHFLIEPTGSGVHLKGYANEPVFESLADLIYQHSLTELALPCKLIIPRADIEDPKFNQKQKQFFDEFIASKEQAKHQPYERTSPDGGYRRYPGDVYVHNEHRIIFE